MNRLLDRYSKREQFEFCLWLLRECTKEINQHMLVNPGFDLASESIKKHLEMSSIAFAHNMSGLWKELDLREKMALLEASANHFVGGGIVDVVVEKDQVTLRVHSCVYDSYAPTMCYGMCNCGSQVLANEILPGCFAENHSSMMSGEDVCTWYYRFDPSKLPHISEKTKRLEHKNIINHYSPDDYEMFSRNVCGEMWLIANRVLLDCVKKEIIINQIEPRLRLLGINLGYKFAFENPFKCHDIGASSTIIDFINITQNQFGTVIDNSDTYIEKEIIECPFSGNTEGVCEQFEIIFNGICEVFSPEYEFKYIQTMPEGASSCRWCIKRKGPINRPR